MAFSPPKRASGSPATSPVTQARNLSQVTILGEKSKSLSGLHLTYQPPSTKPVVTFNAIGGSPAVLFGKGSSLLLGGEPGQAVRRNHVPVLAAKVEAFHGC
jgi:hypothetical protein